MKTTKTTQFMLQRLARQPRAWNVACALLALALLWAVIDSSSVFTAHPAPALRMSSQLPAFEGYGANATGGAGHPVVTVTNLNDSGPGSLREALSGSNRIVNFSVAGTITLATSIVVTGANITIDGFSAPVPGITLINNSGDTLVVHGNSNGPDAVTGANIIIQGLRFRASGNDPLQIAKNAHDIVVDHNSFSLGNDSACDITEGAYNVTFSWNLIANDIVRRAMLISYEAYHLSIHHNIYYNRDSRMPLLANGARGISSGPSPQDPIADVRYNIVWEWKIGTRLVSNDSAHKTTGNVVSNLYFTGPTNNQSNNIVIITSKKPSIPVPEGYIAGNISVQDCRGSAYVGGGNKPVTITHINSPNNHAEFPVPLISGPSTTDQQGRLNEWTRVKSEAGVVSKFADDAVEAAARQAITIPGLSIFSQPWNIG